MLTEIYIKALLVDEELADQVWQAWDKGEIDDRTAWLARAIITHIDRFFLRFVSYSFRNTSVKIKLLLSICTTNASSIPTSSPSTPSPL